MNIHEHQAKQLLKEFGAPVPNGVHGFSVDEIIQKSKSLKTQKYVLKAQIHAGGRGKAGGITIANSLDELKQAANQLFGKTLITNQTGPKGKKVERLYVEEASNIEKEFYLSCLVDRKSSKIAFISSLQGGMDIEETAIKTPEKIITTKVDFNNTISEADCEKIIDVFNLEYDAKDQGIELIKCIYKMFNEKDASLVEINPLILTKENNIICLDAKVILDDNAIFRHPDHLDLRDLKEEVWFILYKIRWKYRVYGEWCGISYGYYGYNKIVWTNTRKLFRCWWRSIKRKSILSSKNNFI